MKCIFIKYIISLQKNKIIYNIKEIKSEKRQNLFRKNIFQIANYSTV